MSNLTQKKLDCIASKSMFRNDFKFQHPTGRRTGRCGQSARGLHCHPSLLYQLQCQFSHHRLYLRLSRSFSSYYAIFVFFLFYRSGLLRLGLPRFSVSRLQARKTFSGGTQLISEHSVHPYSQTVIILPSTLSLYSYNKLAVADTAHLSLIQTKYFQIFTILLCRQHYTICIIKFTPPKSKIIIKL